MKKSQEQNNWIENRDLVKKKQKCLELLLVFLVDNYNYAAALFFKRLIIFNFKFLLT